MRQRYIEYVIGFIAGAALMTFVVGSDMRDELNRVHEQYRDCMLAGDHPTAADMLEGESDQ